MASQCCGDVSRTCPKLQPAQLLIIYTVRRLQVVEQGTAMIVERWVTCGYQAWRVLASEHLWLFAPYFRRFGKFYKRAEPGLFVLLPILDEIRYVTW